MATIDTDEQALSAELQAQMARSLLPGDPTLSPDRLAEAAACVLEAARRRDGEEPAVLIRRAADGERTTRMVFINTDMPFLVDSIAGALAAHGLPIDLLVHPVLPVHRDADGRLLALPTGAGAEGAPRESMIYLETAAIDAGVATELERQFALTLADVRAAVADWPQMKEALAADAARLGDSEGAELLRWLAADRVTLLGHQLRHREGAPADLKGICRAGEPDLLAEETLSRAFAWFDADPARAAAAPLIVKANRVARVHRRVPLDLFLVPVLADGRVTALSIHAGIWTSAALATPPEQVPVLRRHLHDILERHRLARGSHDAKGLVHALTALPHDLLIGFPADDVARVATTMMALTDRPRPRLELVQAPLDRHVFAFVWLPRDLIGSSIRLQVQQLLERAIGAETLDWSMEVEGGALATLRFVLDVRGLAAPVDQAAVDARLQAMLRGWADAVADAVGGTDGPALASRYAESFPPAYRTAYGPAEAAADIARLRHLSDADPDRPLGRDARLYREASDPADQLRLKLYQAGGAMPLSDAVPALENFGFRVLAELPTELTGDTRDTIHDFRLLLTGGGDAAALLARAAAIEPAIVAVINGRAEDDVFNRLVATTGLAAMEADWLRALYRYLRQTGVAFTIYTVVDALRGAPGVTAALVQLFRVRHDPAFSGDRDAAAQKQADAITAGLAGVTALNDDRLLRLYWAVINAVLRTNAFIPAGQEALALKLDSEAVPRLPRPVPWREIWVYSRRVEGIHLRAGPVARGGLRWSDRRDDFRTEILGLMKAQRVKNAVIVPTGAKGGFYPKQLPSPAVDRDAWFAEGTASYKLFIRTLLSVTDNIVGGRTVHPDGVVVRDGADPYFVVAADKGTATFSDTANAIAEERDFWLGDAFASGGSNGYDHKAMGITARGAWLSVQRHFLERGINVQTEPVRVVGCGDMSGDVFGNGMLLSKALKLVAAFDHRHIFIDPDPDPAASWAERQRLFDLPRSSWADYDEAIISPGGGVWPRSAKRIELSEQARAALGVEAAELDPDGLIAAILKAPADLLWFGGIGTYVKASTESNSDVGDPANDALRVNAADLRVAVIGEGANLGITQAARIEFGLNGGRSNTDFIDNSAGVDCSDNEVNIKIALAAAKAAGHLDEDGRRAVLREMTDEVAALVLEDNRLQALALSIAERGGPAAVPSLSALIDALEERGDLDRRTEGLLRAEELGRRAADGKGLTRPELAVLLSSTKLVLQAAIEDSKLADDDALEPLLLGDFPATMQDRFRQEILHHQLRTEIVATTVANRIVNRMGIIHPFELAAEESSELAHVAAAFVGTCDLLRMEPLWDAIDATPMPEAGRLMLFETAALALRGHMADLLRSGPATAPSAAITDMAENVAALVDHVDDLLAAEARDHAGAIEGALREAGAPDELAAAVARLFAIDGAIGLARLARTTGQDPVALANAFITLGEELGLDWAQARASVMNPSDPWDRVLVSGLARDLQQMRFAFLAARLHGTHRPGDPLAEVRGWLDNNAAAVRALRGLVARARAATPLTPAMLAHIASQARSLLQR
ncbi:NAD-glutamate dehydrogenase domain-containing protein [Croceibacterium sp. TMG7-5b_MA50]|uniref:NAD-glutamate dehydrogenase n=1 Tax=Croceibacterium sp. TMG7-5b_MA50 TaxID=3121290 RepID=UPI003221460B